MIFLELVFFVGLIVYCVYIFVINKDFSVSRIIVFILLFIAFIVNTIKLL